MPNTYTANPQGGHTLAADQPRLLANYNYLANTLGTSLKSGDHQISTGGIDTNTFEGRHIQVSLKSLTGGSQPKVSVISDGTDSILYSKNGNLWISSSLNDGPYQLTNLSTLAPATDISRFGTRPNGWTFLPGSIIYQYGRVNGLSGAWPTSPQTLTFATANIAFPTNCFNVFITFIGPTSNSTGDICINSISSTNFVWQFTGSSSSSFDGFYWFSIGN